jgi:hypothetical protein
MMFSILIRLGNTLNLQGRRTLGCLLLLVSMMGIIGFLIGCDEARWNLTTQPAKDKEARQQAEIKAEYEKNGPLPGTIGSVSYIEGRQSINVQGYGLVTRLAGTGSSECPENLRTEIVETIAKYQKLYNPKGQIPSMNSGLLINSMNTAVVKVTGLIPSGAVKDDSFDLYVQALPNTGTTSLEGGQLYTCDLRVYSGPETLASTSRIYARASGPIFINPFEKKQYRGTIQLKRKGYVLGGGDVREDRMIMLVLNQGSYAAARAIEQKINSTFGPPSDDPLWKTAKAVSSNRIELRIPRAFRSQKSHFLELVQSLYIRNDPAYLESMANELARRISDPTVNASAMSDAWESMGRTMIPLIQPFYRSRNMQASYYSCRAGARLGDTPAMERLGEIARDPKNSFRKQAIQTLGFCHDMTARRILRKLLDDPDIDVRIEVYKGLVRTGDISINRSFIGENNFVLDEVSGKAYPMVYVTRSQIAKVVLFGSINLEPPVFYCHPDQSILISADSNAKNLTLIRKTHAGSSSGKIITSLSLSSLLGLLGNSASVDKNGNPTGLGLPYSHVVTILHELCKDGAIPARFKLQEIDTIKEPEEEYLGRPEKDL